MRTILCLGVMTCSVALASDDNATLRRYLDYHALTRVTDAQIDIATSVITFCRDPKDIHGPHIKPGIHLYVSPAAIDSKAKRASTRYLLGTLIVKEKFDLKGDTKPSVITVMEKIADEGRIEDWRFSMVRLSDRSFVRDEAKVSCVDCHSRYAKSDFVSPVTDDLVKAFAQKPNKAPEPTPTSVMPAAKQPSRRP